MQTQATDNQPNNHASNMMLPPAGMEPFDLERACAGAPICTRDGTPAELIAVLTDAPPSFRLSVKLPQYTHARTYCDNGLYHSDGRTESIDLFLLKR